MWGLLIVLAGDPLPRVSWHTSVDNCNRHAEMEVLHAAIATREVVHIECRSYVLPRVRPNARAEVRQ